MAQVADKSNLLMMRTALNAIDAHSEDSVMIGDSVDTDIIMGLETILVLSSVTRREDIESYSYGPARIVESVTEILPWGSVLSAKKQGREPGEHEYHGRDELLL